MDVLGYGTTAVEELDCYTADGEEDGRGRRLVV